MKARLSCYSLSLVLASLALASGSFAQEPAMVAAPPQTIKGVPAEVPSTLFSFHADALPIKQAIAMFGRANHLNIVPDLDVEGNVTVDFQDLPLDLAMHALLEANGFYFSQEGSLIRIRNHETRLFQIDYIHVTRAGQGSNA